MAHWSTRVPKFTYTPDCLAYAFVPTVETARLSHLLDLLLPNRHHVMFVGGSGTGKTAVMHDALRRLDPEAVATTTINMSSQHDGPSLQAILEAPLEKKAGGCPESLWQSWPRGGSGQQISTSRSRSFS